jgi:glycosyltransferase involved in cell wall biosynthesis
MPGAVRIAHVITRLIVGGAQENTLATCVGLRARGHAVDLITGPQTGPEGSLAEQARAAGVPVLVVDELRREPAPWHDVVAVDALARLFRAGCYDVVHTHSGKAGILGRLAARLARVPVVVHTIHGPSFHPHQNPAGNWVFRGLEQIAAEWTTQFVSVADAMTEQYLAAGIGTPRQYVTIRSGIDWEAYGEMNSGTGVPPVAPGISATPTGGTPVPRSPVVGMVARLFRLKGHEFLFAAAPRIRAAVPGVKFLLVGDGPYRQRFERAAAALGGFEFAGLVSPTEVPRWIGKMTVLVHLSLREGLPRAVVQALAAGKPVAAFDVDGAREVCRPGVTGFLVRAGDADGLAAAVIRLLQDRALAGRMGLRGRELVRAEFAVERMVQQIEELYRRLQCAGR